MLISESVSMTSSIQFSDGQIWSCAHSLSQMMDRVPLEPYGLRVGVGCFHKGNETEQDLVGILEAKAFLCTLFPDYRKQASFSLHDLPWAPRIRFKQLLIREGKGGGDKGETVVQPWDRGLASPQWIHRTVSLSCFADTETPFRWEKIIAHTNRETPDLMEPEGGEADSLSPHPQPIRRMSVNWPHPLWTIPIKLLTTRSRSGHSFKGVSLLWSPLPGKEIMLFFTTSPKTLSLRVNSVLGYRSWIWLQKSGSWTRRKNGARAGRIAGALGIPSNSSLLTITPVNSLLSSIISLYKYQSFLNMPCPQYLTPNPRQESILFLKKY